MAELVRRVACAQDRAAFEELFDHYAPRLASYLQRLGADESLAEEVTQDAMLALWRKAALFDPAKSSVSTWLFRIARNRRIDLLRRAGGTAVDLDDAIRLACDAPKPDAEIADRERDMLVRRAMTDLPSDQQRLVRLAFFEGLSHSEIAAHQGLPLGTVKSRIRLAFGRLRRRLGSDGIADAN
ncbi:sigma-70 family RNA polymerase sigma factor [Methylopila musalis]|uniref:Sigma-70 family RNA polymerase sigma factor n=1 Tax=Methylopila musalis TaxID=1134781 RepID=A0ABW3Z448_9HYPH